MSNIRQSVPSAADLPVAPYTRAVNAEFNWWLLIVGLVAGAGLVWVVLLDSRRREVDIDDEERPREAAWLAATLADEGLDVTPEVAERLLVLHRAYLEAPPPDDPPVSPAVPFTRDLGSATSELADDDRVGLERRAPDIGQ
jgi:hypothetical protein